MFVFLIIALLCILRSFSIVLTDEWFFLLSVLCLFLSFYTYKAIYQIGIYQYRWKVTIISCSYVIGTLITLKPDLGIFYQKYIEISLGKYNKTYDDFIVAWSVDIQVTIYRSSDFNIALQICKLKVFFKALIDIRG